MTIAALAVIAALPGAFWLWFYLRKDRENPEPRKIVALTFLFGMISTVPAAALEFAAEDLIKGFAIGTFTSSIISTFIIVAPIEEFGKWIIIKKFVFDRGKFDEAFDGMIYAIAVSLGFATLENIFATLSFGLDTLALRFATATLLHALTAGIMGYFFGLAYLYPERKNTYVIQGLLASTLLHGLYNFILMTGTLFTIALLATVLLSMYALVAAGILRMKRRDNVEQALLFQRKKIKAEYGSNQTQVGTAQ